MISVIVCSKNKSERTAFAEQLKRTIGITYELIMINNEEEKLSISSAYNKGAEAAKYPYLCFVHEDIKFYTIGWGPELLTHLKNNITGFLGMAGSTLKTWNPSPWWITNDNPIATSYYRFHFMRSGVIQQILVNDTVPLQEVLCLDGFFLACRKEVWEATHFDEQTFDGFHYYDMDICLAAHQKGWKNYVWVNCLIEHNSSGSINESWLQSTEKFQRKWQDKLPAFIVPVGRIELNQLEQLSLIDYIHTLIRYRYMLLSLKYITRLLLKYKRTPGSRQVVKTYFRRLLYL